VAGFTCNKCRDAGHTDANCTACAKKTKKVIAINADQA
jgi:hypothetical protein